MPGMLDLHVHEAYHLILGYGVVDMEKEPPISLVYFMSQNLSILHKTFYILFRTRSHEMVFYHTQSLKTNKMS